MKKILSYIALPIALIFMASCSKEEIPGWSGEDRIGFTTAVAGDTLKTYSFVFEPETVTRTSFMVEVSTEGRVYDIPRYVKLKQVSSGEGNDAVPGVHYVPFDDPSVQDLYVVPAGASVANLPIILLRNESLRESGRNLRIELEMNNDFLLTVDKNKLHRTILFADILTKPEIWGIYGENANNGKTYCVERYFGYYGQVKHRFMIDITGMPFDNDHMQTLFMFFNTSWGWRPKDSNYIIYLQGFLQQKLEERNTVAGTPLKEADGRIVDFYDFARDN